MTWIPQVDALFSHVVSQWTYRWLELPRLGLERRSEANPSEWDCKSFVAYIKQRWVSEAPTLPWMRTVLEQQLSPVALATLVYEHVQKVGAHAGFLLDFYHPLYPPLLRNIADPPNVLSGLGSLELLKRDAIAVVGSRKASALALAETRVLSRSLAERGQVLVSGGALGCDIAAHLGALAAGHQPARTAIVFAGGLAKLYPSYNQKDFDELAAAGALFLSERLWDYPARPFDFPVRNRIVTGMCSRLLVMQAGERSGAKVSANCAIDQGREVYVLLHPPGDVRALGSQVLIEEGAIPFASAVDFLSLDHFDPNR